MSAPRATPCYAATGVSVDRADCCIRLAIVINVVQPIANFVTIWAGGIRFELEFGFARHHLNVLLREICAVRMESQSDCFVLCHFLVSVLVQSFKHRMSSNTGDERKQRQGNTYCCVQDHHHPVRSGRFSTF